METIFWVSLGFIGYVYVGYPALLAVWTLIADRLSPSSDDRRQSPERRLTGRAGNRKARGKSDRRSTPFGVPTADLPGISVIICARNEAHCLPSRVQNLMESAYPNDRMQIIVVSDGSTDGTERALVPFRDRVEFLMLPPGGKARALNAAVRRARYPILVFADARQAFAPDAIGRLTRHFADDAIGAVSGELVLDCELEATDSSIGEGVGAYWKYEKWLRRHEGLVGSTVGVTGAIYAMRRSLWQPLPPDTILDDLLGPMRVVLKHHRVRFDETARAFDRVSKNAADEFRRKVRTLAGNFQLLAREPRLLLPIVNPVWLQFMSHKVGRLLVPYALIAVVISSAWLASTSAFFALAFTAQAAFYALAMWGAVLDHKARVPVPRRAHASRTDGRMRPRAA